MCCHILYGRQNIGLPKMSTSKSLEPVDMLDYMQKGIKVVDAIKVANELILK